MEIKATSVKELRARSGAGIMDCKDALREAGGDLEKASDLLRKKGLVAAGRRSGRATREGLVGSYVHAGGRLGVLIEVNCETDFVARTDEFQKLAYDIAMQVAAMGPVYIDKEEIEDGDTRLPAETSLMQQSFIKNGSTSVGQMVGELSAKVGENIRVVRFNRLEVGE
jgi:elongation factor Ts